MCGNVMKDYIELKDLEVYRAGRELSRLGWEIYSNLDWQTKKVIGDQFITATDSFWANVTKGYSRFYYLEKIRFYYIARASLNEALEYWLELLLERNKISSDKHQIYKESAIKARIKLSNFINSTRRAKEQ